MTETKVQNNQMAAADGWIAGIGTWSYSSADAPTYVISIDADVTTLISLGMRIKLTHGGSVKYFIVTAVGAFGGGVTLVTVYGGTDYTLAAGAITLPYYSMIKAPVGFPLNPLKWTVETRDTSDRSQAAPGANTWYNLGSLSISIPIGMWRVYYKTILWGAYDSNTFIRTYATLSTANNSDSDSDFKTAVHLTDNTSVNHVASATVTTEKFLLLAAKTSYYLNAMTSLTMTSINFKGDQAPTIIRAICAYL